MRYYIGKNIHISFVQQ